MLGQLYISSLSQHERVPLSTKQSKEAPEVTVGSKGVAVSKCNTPSRRAKGLGLPAEVQSTELEGAVLSLRMENLSGSEVS